MYREESFALVGSPRQASQKVHLVRSESDQEHCLFDKAPQAVKAVCSTQIIDPAVIAGCKKEK